MNGDESPIKVEIPRDRELERRMLEAVIADRNDSPRNKQVTVGPSAIGFCRELLRAQLFEDLSAAGGMPDVVTEETHWAAAAHVGTVMGEALEKIFGERLSNVVTQNRVTTTFPMIGVQISGALDLAFLDEEQVTDLKSTTDIGGLLYDLQKNAEMIETLLMIWREGRLFNWSVETPDGGYELTRVLLGKFKKLQYWTQVATYVVGAVQAGVLAGTASGRLVFYDRAGDFQEFLAVIISNEEIAMFFDIAQHRVMQVAQAQELFERAGNLHLIHELRDQTPSFCFSPKVMCPLRERCWGGSQWEPEEVLESAEVSGALDRYIEGRRLAKIGDGMTKAAREELKGIEGATPDGRKVSWPGGRINVVETSKGKATREAAPKSAVDVAQEAMARVALVAEVEQEREVLLGVRSDGGPHLHRTKPGTKACAEGRCNGATIVGPLLEESAEAEQGGEVGYPEQDEVAMELMHEPIERDPRVDAVRFVDTDPRPLDSPGESAVDASVARLHAAQAQQEATGQVARNRAAAQAKRDGSEPAR
jgi:hypothetical protein